MNGFDAVYCENFPFWGGKILMSFFSLKQQPTQQGQTQMMNPSMQQSLQQTLNQPQGQQQGNQGTVNNFHQTMSAAQRAELMAQRARQLSQFPPNVAMNQTPQGPAPPYRNPSMNAAANNMNAGNPNMNMGGMGPSGKPMLSAQAQQFQLQQQQQRI